MAMLPCTPLKTRVLRPGSEASSAASSLSIASLAVANRGLARQGSAFGALGLCVGGPDLVHFWFPFVSGVKRGVLVDRRWTVEASSVLKGLVGSSCFSLGNTMSKPKQQEQPFLRLSRSKRLTARRLLWFCQHMGEGDLSALWLDVLFFSQQVEAHVFFHSVLICHLPACFVASSPMG